MMMVGGMEETEAMGSASNIQKNSLLLFPSGTNILQYNQWEYKKKFIYFG